MSKLSDYLEQQKIDARRVLLASKNVESLRPEDRETLAARKRHKKGDESAKEAAERPCRSGKPLTRPTLAKALRGDQLSKRSRQCVLRAVNAALAIKKKPEASAAEIF
ncbi:MAG: hypothetical protein OXU20_05390 [Myxococcales bacterium]|nr:hypothetical protein [Myxococcales bacterium]MDD9967443.1 hypothetical protein [Myxococcales bacterium]